MRYKQCNTYFLCLSINNLLKANLSIKKLQKVQTKTMFIHDGIVLGHQKDLLFLWYRRSLNKQIWFQQAPNSHSYANNKYITKPLISIPLAEMYSENCQISKMERFANIVNSLLQGDPSSMFQRILNTQNCTKAVQKQYKSCTKTV